MKPLAIFFSVLVLCATVLLFSAGLATSQTYPVENVKNTKDFQATFNTVATDIAAKLPLAGGTVVGAVLFSTNGVLVPPGTNAPATTAGAIATVGTNLYIANGTNWIAK